MEDTTLLSYQPFLHEFKALEWYYKNFVCKGRFCNKLLIKCLEHLDAKNIQNKKKYNTREASLFFENTMNTELKWIHEYYRKIFEFQKKQGVYMIILGKVVNLKNNFLNIPENTPEESLLVKIGYSFDIFTRGKQHFKFFIEILKNISSLEVYSLINLHHYNAKDAENYITKHLSKNRDKKISVSSKNETEKNQEKSFNEIYVIDNTEILKDISNYISHKEKKFKDEYLSNELIPLYEEKIRQQDEEHKRKDDEIRLLKERLTIYEKI